MAFKKGHRDRIAPDMGSARGHGGGLGRSIGRGSRAIRKSKRY